MKSLKGFKNDASWIQQNLAFPVTNEQLEFAILRLRNLGMWVNLQESIGEPLQYLTENEVKSSTLKTFYRDLLQHFLLSLDLQTSDDRHFRSMSIAVPKDKVKIAKERINEFMVTLQNELSGKEPDDKVIQIFSGFISATSGGVK
jgi:hypothetical protein